jgi:hypothetical protein
MAKQHDAEKAGRIAKAREHYELRKLGRPTQRWSTVDHQWVKA